MPGGTWNLADGYQQSTPMALRNTSGTLSSTVKVTWDSEGFYETSHHVTASALFDSYLWTQGASKTISLTGLVANQTYTIAAISQDINPPAIRAATFTANGVSASTVNNTVFEAPFTLGVNYVLIWSGPQN